MSAVRVADGMLHVGDHSLPFIAGEIQFWRMDPDTWEPAVRAAKDAGVTIVSTYLSWRRHEPVRGERSFAGETDPRLDVTRFLRICAEAGVYVQLKPGPWICAEEQGGGYPDWLLADTALLALDDAGEPVVGYNPPFQHPVPSYTDERYLENVREWFAAMWEVVRDQVHPRGPVIAIQLDNEPSVAFQDSLYGTDYSASSVVAFRHWLRRRYDDDVRRLQSAWGEGATFQTVEPPRRPSSDRAPEPAAKLRDWTLFKTSATGEYLATLQRMHRELGGDNLLYTVNVVTHPIHDVPVSHAAMRAATGAAIGEDHYYIPPLDTADIHRLARSAATAREAGEPLPWVPELQAGIWRSPGEIVGYPDPTPLEQEVWWGAAVALGFAGFNLYMLADRENWQYAPLTARGDRSPFFAPIGQLTITADVEPGALAASVEPAAIVAWHRDDANAAYSAVGTSRLPDVPWHSTETVAAYHAWDATLLSLTAAGVPYDLWDTEKPFPRLSMAIPLVVPPGSGIAPSAVENVARTGRAVIHPTADETWSELRGRTVHVRVQERPAERTLATIRRSGDEAIIHVVHWGPGADDATIAFPDGAEGSLETLPAGRTVPVRDGLGRIPLVIGHHIYRLRRQPAAGVR